MNYIFPLAFLLNNFSITALLIVVGLVGETHLAADIGIIQGATMALFYSFSANARSIVLNPQMRSSTKSFLTVRALLIAPLGFAAIYLSIYIANAGWMLALALTLRRSVEWISEIHLSEMEFNDDRESARRFVVLQTLLFLTALGWILSNVPLSSIGLLSWALLPLLLSARFVRQQVTLDGRLRVPWGQLLPHFGSTAIIGITVYVFRLLILIHAGKDAAGDLYTAFAIGGSAGSVFTQVLGPSIALHEERIGKAYFPGNIKRFLFLFLVTGVVLLVAVYADPGIFAFSGKSPFFWQALGLSMMGGFVMVFAQAIRFRLLQRFGENDVFGPDVLQNILVLASIPYLFNLMGKNALTSLYLISSFLAYSSYLSAEKGDSTDRVLGVSKNALHVVIAFLLFIPAFFQLGIGIFRDPSMTYSSDGLLSRLPIPLSVPACFAGLFLLGNYRRAHASLTFIFVTFILMLMSVMVSTQGHGIERHGKFILLTQFILPAFAFVLGQMYTPDREGKWGMEKIFFVILAVIVPAQLLFTWLQGHFLLSPYVYLFSIYQHFQYVSVILICGYLLMIYSQWRIPFSRKILLLYAPIFGIYAMASVSIMAILSLFSGITFFIFYCWKHHADKRAVLVLFFVFLPLLGYLHFARDEFSFRTDKFVGYSILSQNSPTSHGHVPKNITQRLVYWRYYKENVLSSFHHFFFGHAKPPDRSRYPSAHNYYLDLTYNFGFLALLPLLVMIGLTLKWIAQFRYKIFNDSSLVGLTFVVLLLLLVDNSLKVGLRQPYPGIITFFLWGALLSRLLAFRQET